MLFFFTPDINKAVFLNLLIGFYFHSNPTNWNKYYKIDALLGRAGRSVHILWVCKKYGYSLDLFFKTITSIVWLDLCYLWQIYRVSSHDKHPSKIDKLQERAVRFGFLKGAMPILSLAEASDNKLWKSVTNSTEGPLTDLLPPIKTRLLRNHGHSYVLLQIRTERFKCCFIYLTVNMKSWTFVIAINRELICVRTYLYLWVQRLNHIPLNSKIKKKLHVITITISLGCLYSYLSTEAYAPASQLKNQLLSP